MTTAQKSRIDQAKQTLTALRDERTSASEDDQKQPAFVENKKQLDAAIKALDAVKATGG